MAVLSQYNYIFAIGTIFAFLDAWNIGANDVANSFASSVSARSLTMKQAMGIASVMEFSGALIVGARVSETIRTKIIDPLLFKENPAALMLAMMSAVIASSLYLSIATRFGLPVSTTHSIMGGIIGAGFATVGPSRIHWGWTGVSTVFSAWVIAPAIAGSFSAIIFLITKHCVMLRKNPARNALFSVPIYFFLTGCLIAMLLVWKGASAKIHLDDRTVAGVILGVGSTLSILVVIFLLPYTYRRVLRRDWRVKKWHIVKGPFLLLQGDVPLPPEGCKRAKVRNFYDEDEADDSEKKVVDQSLRLDSRKGDTEMGLSPTSDNDASELNDGSLTSNSAQKADNQVFKNLVESVDPCPPGSISNPKVLFWYFKRLIFRGVEKDVISLQKKRNLLSGNVKEIHSHAAQYDNNAEYMYSLLQVMTAAAASFTHGANDVSNAIGPYATIYLIWTSGDISNKVPVPLWILAFGGAAIVLGLWMYGYNIMRNLGNRLTLISPSRGFAMELGSTITIIMATRLKLPVSTTQCITGSTVGVGLCNGSWRSINWRMVAWIYFGWFITLPITALISGSLLGFVINAPRWSGITT